MYISASSFNHAAALTIRWSDTDVMATNWVSVRVTTYWGTGNGRGILCVALNTNYITHKLSNNSKDKATISSELVDTMPHEPRPV